jgi:D-alanyl-D-alanine carboxypeptidase/D-alanyl-D-alanine-endopeptidase (penicillin-binding protein 4)
VVALLDHMLDAEPKLRQAWLDSLAVAGRSGTLARRMRGTAAQGNCFGKTGTITGVSALSGYCDTGGGRLIAFSILMSGVRLDRAHVAQDRIAALVARYNP